MLFTAPISHWNTVTKEHNFISPVLLQIIIYLFIHLFVYGVTKTPLIYSTVKKL